MFGRYLRIAVLFLTAFSFAAVGLVPLGNSGFGANSAMAQERQPGLLELLLRGGRKETKPQIQKVPRAKKPVVKKRSTKSAPRRAKKPASSQTARKRAPAPAPSVETVEKAENAARVLVVGDFIADGMGQALEESFADVANVIVEKRVNGSSGLVRDDFYNWPEEITAIIEEVNPSIVVVMLGSNDRQAMRVDGKTAKVRSEEWDAEYEKRVNAFVTAVRQAQKPLMWVGSPPFRFRSMSADMLAFNAIYQSQTEQVGGIFVDIWDGFVDENGGFIRTGADVKGQQVRLRAADGINFTKAGKEKMAFYVERQLKQLLGDAASPLLISLANESAPMMTLPPLETEADLQRTNPISFDDPDLDGGSVLLGDMTKEVTSIDNPLQAKSVRQRLVEDGVPPPRQPGRAGNFAWPG